MRRQIQRRRLPHANPAAPTQSTPRLTLTPINVGEQLTIKSYRYYNHRYGVGLSVATFRFRARRGVPQCNAATTGARRAVCAKDQIHRMLIPKDASYRNVRPNRGHGDE